MSNFGQWVVFALLVSLPARGAEDREALWQQDLKFMEAEISGHQLDFGKLYPHFHEEMAALQVRPAS
jgi:hypothetical protein